MRILTFGHGTADAERMTHLLRGAGVQRLLDVRTSPGSRRNPAASRKSMSEWLPHAGITYRWDARLGGWRTAREDGPDTALRHQSFRGYAEHMRSVEFREAIEELLADAEIGDTAVMCAESVWWRCHRKLIADFLVLVKDVEVYHLMHDGSVQSHRPSPEARLSPDQESLIYDAGQSPLDS